MAKPAVALVLAVVAAISGCGGVRPTPISPARTAPPAAPSATAAQPGGGAPICGRAAKPPATWAHVIWIWMENRDYAHLVGNPQAPYENGTLIASCGLATNFHNITHPSLPNYLAATSGQVLARTDCQPDACSTAAPSLFAQLRAAGKSWRAYQESMPANCHRADTGVYAARHNPPLYYTPIAADCDRWDLPMGSTSSGNLASDLRAGALPDFAFITPNLCNDTHDCPLGTGDRWLASWVPSILASPAYTSGTTVLVLTWDEGDSSGSGDCAANTTDPGCHVATVVVAPTVPTGTRSDTLFNHYSLLKTTEQLLGLPITLGHAADPSTRGMRTAFNL